MKKAICYFTISYLILHFSVKNRFNFSSDSIIKRIENFNKIFGLWLKNIFTQIIESCIHRKLDCYQIFTLQCVSDAIFDLQLSIGQLLASISVHIISTWKIYKSHLCIILCNASNSDQLFYELDKDVVKALHCITLNRTVKTISSLI